VVTNKTVISLGEGRQTIRSCNLERLFNSLKGHSKTGAQVKATIAEGCIKD